MVSVITDSIFLQATQVRLIGQLLKGSLLLPSLKILNIFAVSKYLVISLYAVKF